jgi:hypothetical protein
MAAGTERTYDKINPNKYEQYGMQPYGYKKYRAMIYLINPIKIINFLFPFRKVLGFPKNIL